MSAYLCETCGVQHAPVADHPDAPPERCAVCQDERQYVGWNGQRWTTSEGLRAGGRRNEIAEIEPGLWGIATTPSFGIGQRAHLIRTPAGNLLWECVGVLDDETVAAVRDLGGISAIAISHPHFYSAMADWSHAFDAPIWLHAADREWVMRPDPAIRFWDGDRADPLPGSRLTLLRMGGHFPGATAVHWPDGADGRGVLLCGDVPQVVQDRRWVSFMYSYPNLIPMRLDDVRHVARMLATVRFDRLYGSWKDRVVASDAAAAVARSAERYLAFAR